jgi:hypothetical protein
LIGGTFYVTFDRFIDSDTFYSPTAIASGYLDPALYLDPDSFYTPRLITAVLRPPRFMLQAVIPEIAPPLQATEAPILQLQATEPEIAPPLQAIEPPILQLQATGPTTEELEVD